MPVPVMSSFKDGVDDLPLSPMSSRQKPHIEDDMKDLKLSKYGFGFKLTSFTAMLGWIGMITSLAAGIGGLSIFTAFIDLARNHSARNGHFVCLQPVGDLVCGLWVAGGLFLCLSSAIWFYLSFQLRKKVKENDLVGVTKTLKIICYIQQAFSILLSGPLMVFPIICIIGIAERRTKLVKIYVIYTIVMIILFNLLEMIGFIILASTLNAGTYFLYGILECIGFNMVLIYLNGFIIILHTIMEHNDSKFTIFKNKSNDFENPIQNNQNNIIINN